MRGEGEKRGEKKWREEGEGEEGRRRKERKGERRGRERRGEGEKREEEGGEEGRRHNKGQWVSVKAKYNQFQNSLLQMASPLILPNHIKRC